MPISGRPDRSSFSAIVLQESWYPCQVLPGFDEVEDDTTEGILAVKFIIGLDFAVTRYSPELCWGLFAIVSEHTVELIWLILNKHSTWFHSSQLNIPFVCMSASWFLGSMYLICIFGSKLIRLNNQSKATLWVQETCLIVGLLPSMNILITASLSSNTNNKASWCEDWTFEGIKSMLFRTLAFPWDLWLLSMLTGRPGLSAVWVVFPKTETIRSPKSRAGIP